MHRVVYLLHSQVALFPIILFALKKTPFCERTCFILLPMLNRYRVYLCVGRYCIMVLSIVNSIQFNQECFDACNVYLHYSLSHIHSTGSYGFLSAPYMYCISSVFIVSLLLLLYLHISIFIYTNENCYVDIFLTRYEMNQFNLFVILTFSLHFE